MTRPKRQVIRRTILFFVLLLFPITLNYYSPFLIMQSASEGIAVFSTFLWAGWAITSPFIGRVACAYICPLGAIQMLTDEVLEVELKRIKYLRVVKYIFAIAWVGSIAFFAFSAGGYREVNLLYNTESGVSVTGPFQLITYYIVIAVPLLPALFLGKRAFCHYFCPFSVLNIVGSVSSRLLRLPALHLRAAPEECKQCKRCDRTCPMSLPVSEMVQRGSMDHAECILCASCVDGCRFGAIRYAWARQSVSPGAIP